MLLTAVIFVPLLGALALYLAPARMKSLQRSIAVAASGITLALSLGLAVRFDWAHPIPQLGATAPWIPSIGAAYLVAVDGLSLPFLLLTALLIFLCVAYAWREQRRPREYYALFLVMETGLLGFFATFDLLLFYFFFEISLVPMYFIIGLWGHERAREAAMKFFLYTRVGALALLLAILALYLAVQPHTFDLRAIIAAQPFAGAGVGPSLVLLGFFLAFAIKLPVVPLHSWLPDAHTEAPTEGSVALAGLLLKLGGYGFLRVALPTVPGALQQWGLWLGALAVISAIYGAAAAMAQSDLKRLVAFSSVNHMGYVLLGIAVAGAAGVSAADRVTAATGAAYQMVAHGLVTGALFFLVGMLADRVGTREIARLSGLWTPLPLWGALLALAMFASLGLPGLAQFPAEAQIVLGTLGFNIWLAVGMLVAILITTAMFLWTLQRILLGKVADQWARLPQLTSRELVAVVPLAALIIGLGVFPGPLSSLLSAALRAGPLAPLMSLIALAKPLASDIAGLAAGLATTIGHALAGG